VRFGMSLLMVKCLRWQGLVDDHAAIVGNTFAGVDSVRKYGCRLFPQDVKAQPKGLSRYYYPDLIVTCDDG
jgi:Uma2 family endonuclease